MQSLLILGRQPALGLAELESLYGPEKVQPVGATTAALVAVDPCLLAFDRLGGSTKFCKVLTVLDTTNWKQIEKFLLQVSPGHSEHMPEGKMQLGLSLYGFKETPARIGATGLSIKKVIRKTGRPVRLVPTKTTELNAAQIIHNNLTGPNGWELVFVADGARTIVVTTHQVEETEKILTHLMFISDGKITLNRSMNAVAATSAEVKMATDKAAAAQALNPLYEREVFGKKLYLFEGADRGKLAELGEIHTPSVADIFVAKMKGAM